jgi:hypothetical protein
VAREAAGQERPEGDELTRVQAILRDHGEVDVGCPTGRGWALACHCGLVLDQRRVEWPFRAEDRGHEPL